MKAAASPFLLEIGGIVFGLRFGPSDRPYDASLLSHTIRSRLKGFVGRKTKKADILIEFKDLSDPVYLYHSRLQAKYAPFYRWKDNRRIETYFSISFAQFQTLLTDIINRLSLTQPLFFLHAAAVKSKHGSHIFVGKEGAGKSTLMRNLSATHNPLADDTVLVRNIDGHFLLYQTPFIEKELDLPKKSGGTPVTAVYEIHKGSRFAAQRVSDQAAMIKTLSKHLWAQWESSKIRARHFSLLAGFLRAGIPVYRLTCSKNRHEALSFFTKENNIIE